MSLLIQGGTVVSPAGAVPADVLVEGEKISALAAPGSETSVAWGASADRIVDARLLVGRQSERTPELGRVHRVLERVVEGHLHLDHHLEVGQRPACLLRTLADGGDQRELVARLRTVIEQARPNTPRRTPEQQKGAHSGPEPDQPGQDHHPSRNVRPYVNSGLTET